MSFLSQKKKVIPSKLCVQIETGQKIWYALNREKPVSQIYATQDAGDGESDESFAKPEPVHFISATKEDFRVSLKKAVSAKEAHSAAVRSADSTDALSIINQSKTGAVYATPLSRLRDESGEIVSVFPLMQISDQILKAADHPAGEKGMIVYQFDNADGHDLLIFVNISDMGSMSYKAAIFEEDSEKAIELHKNVSGFDESVKYYVVNKDGLFEALDNLDVQFYPVAVPLVSMQNINAVTPYVAAVFIAGVVGVGTWSLGIKSELKSVQEQQIEAQNKIVEINARMDEVLTSNPAGFATLTSIEFANMFSESEMFYLPTSVMKVSAVPMIRKYEMTMPIKSNNVGTRSSINDQDLLTAALTRKVAEPCAVDSIIYTGDLNEIKASYSCASSNTDMRSLGL